jgi:hypothetical protein
MGEWVVHFEYGLTTPEGALISGDRDPPCGGQAVVDGLLAPDQHMGQELIDLTPCARISSVVAWPSTSLTTSQQRFGPMRVMLGQDVQADMLLGNVLDGRREGTPIVDVLRIAEDRASKRLRLGSGFVMVSANRILLSEGS